MRLIEPGGVIGVARARAWAPFDAGRIVVVDVVETESGGGTRFEPFETLIRVLIPSWIRWRWRCSDEAEGDER